MADQRDDVFRVKPRPPKGASRATERSFLSRVAMAMGNVGGVYGRSLGSAPVRGGKRGRGWVTARLMNSNPGPRARRVVVKTRLVVFKRAGARSAATHLRYIERDGVGRDGQPGQAYSRDADAADVKAFEERSKGDRHQFRFIVAPEDAVELEDLRDFTRELMSTMEHDLGTTLEWVAVDHWDTDNPHTHVVLRGKDDKRENLVIGREYIAHGMRTRAGELATEWLGPRTELEIQRSLRREVDQERWTGLDRELQARARGGRVDLSMHPKNADGLRRRALLIGRLQRLEVMNLARETDKGVWALHDDVEHVLRRLGERGDIIRTMQRAFTSPPREFAIGGEPPTQPLTGKIVAKGFSEEPEDRPYVVVDGLDGRGHYVVLPSDTDLGTLPVGGIVQVTARSGRTADRNIAARAVNGTYQPADHLRDLQASVSGRVRAEQVVKGHVRRLEALRRAGIVERVSDGVWRVPSDLAQQGERYDRARHGNVSVDLRSHLSVDQQVRTVGATWLDHQLIDGARPEKGSPGFAGETYHAMRERAKFLVEQGLTETRDGQVFASPNMLAKLRDRELADVAKRITRETGLLHRPLIDGVQISGTYRRSILLASGRFAMLDNGLGFALVPWRPVIEQALGRKIAAVMRGGDVDWQLGRQRGIGL